MLIASNFRLKIIDFPVLYNSAAERTQHLQGENPVKPCY